MDKNTLLLYAITDNDCIGERDFFREVENALKGGVTILQLREKNMSTEHLIEKAKKLRPICNKYNVPLIINDDVQAAIQSGADGVHVGADDMDVAEIRKKTGNNFIIGATAKTLEQAIKAQNQGADYLGCGALFPSPTKQNAKPMTPETLKQITSSINIPVVAIGGLTYDNIDIIKDSGVSGAAVISAIFAENDTEEAASQLKQKISQIVWGVESGVWS